jgi:hypothetical protein
MPNEKRAKITTTRFMRVWHRRRQREHDHDERVVAKQSQIEMAEALKESHESAGNTVEVKRLVIRLRLLRQELRYMKK